MAMVKLPEELVRSLEGSELNFLFILSFVVVWEDKRGVIVNRSLHDEFFQAFNVIPRVKFFFKFQIEEIKKKILLSAHSYYNLK